MVISFPRRCVSLITVALLLMGGHAIAQSSLKIGIIGPFTGPSADFGNPMLNGIKLAVDEINAVGGYLGRPLELIVKDDKANPDEGLKQSQALIAEKASVVVGFCNTGVAIFADKTGYGEAGLQDVLKALEAKNLKPVHVARFDVGVKDLSDDMKAAKAAGAEVVFSYTVGPENAVIAKSKQALGWKVPQVGAWPLSFPFFIDGAKEAAEGALMAQTFIAEPSNERRASFLTAYARK
jgi:ABC-type branched-subunit amino acid transport system substrate-binding protein